MPFNVALGLRTFSSDPVEGLPVLIVALDEEISKWYHHPETPNEWLTDKSVQDIDSHKSETPWGMPEWVDSVSDPKLEEAVLSHLALYTVGKIAVVDYEGTTGFLDGMDGFKSWREKRQSHINQISSTDTRGVGRGNKAYCRNIKIHHIDELRDDKYSNVMWKAIDSFWEVRSGEYNFTSDGRSGGWAIPKESIEVLNEDCLDGYPDETLAKTVSRLDEFNESVDECIGDFIAECDQILEDRAEEARSFVETAIQETKDAGELPHRMEITFHEDHWESSYPDTPRTIEFKAIYCGFKASIGVVFDPDVYDDNKHGTCRWGANGFVVNTAEHLMDGVSWFVEHVENYLRTGCA